MPRIFSRLLTSHSLKPFSGGLTPLRRFGIGLSVMCLAATASPANANTNADDFDFHLDLSTPSGQAITVELRPNDSLVSGLSSELRSSLALRPMIGHVREDANDSWARIGYHVDTGTYGGLVYTAGQLISVSGSTGRDAQIPRVRALDGGDIFDNLPTQTALSCGATRHQPISARAESVTLDEQRGSACFDVELGLVADATFVAELGGETQANEAMVDWANQVDGIFRAQFDWGIVIASVQSFADPTEPSFNADELDVPIEAFSAWREQTMPEMGLAHLFVSRVREGQVGQGWVGGLCDAYAGTSVSNELGDPTGSVILMAHELGHTFGADHDTVEQYFIMEEVLSEAVVDSFSNESVLQINERVEVVLASPSSCLFACGVLEEDTRIEEEVVEEEVVEDVDTSTTAVAPVQEDETSKTPDAVAFPVLQNNSDLDYTFSEASDDGDPPLLPPIEVEPTCQCSTREGSAPWGLLVLVALSLAGVRRRVAARA